MHDRTIGVLAAYHVTAGYFSEAHEGTLEKIAEKAAPVVHDAQAFEKVRTESLTDPLTGLHNSRALLDHLEKEMSKADRYRTERAILVIDVDRFKLINDRFGHLAGDRALQFIARAIRGSVRVYDFCARQGGDEFIVVLQECDATQARERAVELREAVSGIPFEACAWRGRDAGDQRRPRDVSVGRRLVRVAHSAAPTSACIRTSPTASAAASPACRCPPASNASNRPGLVVAGL